MKTKNIKIAAVTLAALSMGVAGSASAIGLTFDQFDGTDQVGSLSYDGNGGALTGNSINFDYIYNSNDRSDQNSRFVCVGGCTLNFMTGSNTTENGNGYKFSAGGNYVLTGNVYRREANGNGATGGLIASGDIFSGTFAPSTGTKRGSQFVLNGFGDGTLNQDLLDALGASDANPFSYLNTTYTMNNASFGSNGSVQGNVNNTDFSVVSEAAPVPEPSELAMFGLGLVLVGGGLFARRRA